MTEQTEEDRAITERQVRAYKRRVDELSEKLTEANDKTKQVQDRCDELIKVETERNELKGKVGFALFLILCVQVYCCTESTENKHMYNNTEYFCV